MCLCGIVVRSLSRRLARGPGLFGTSSLCFLGYRLHCHVSSLHPLLQRDLMWSMCVVYSKQLPPHVLPPLSVVHVHSRVIACRHGNIARGPGRLLGAALFGSRTDAEQRVSVIAVAVLMEEVPREQISALGWGTPRSDESRPAEIGDQPRNICRRRSDFRRRPLRSPLYPRSAYADLHYTASARYPCRV